ncbi:MAG: cytochrome c [Sphingomonas sp.]
MRRFVLLGLATAGLVGVAVAQTPARTPAELIQNRQAGYKQIGAAFRGLFEQTRASEPNPATIRQHSATIARLAPNVSGWFPAGTGPETGLRTRAKAEIWTSPQDFRTGSVNLVVAARRMEQAAAGSDMAAIREAFRALQGTCAACHDRFRGPEI